LALHGVPALDGALAPAQQFIERQRFNLGLGPMKDSGDISDQVIGG